MLKIYKYTIVIVAIIIAGTGRILATDDGMPAPTRLGYRLMAAATAGASTVIQDAKILTLDSAISFSICATGDHLKELSESTFSRNAAEIKDDSLYRIYEQFYNECSQKMMNCNQLRLGLAWPSTGDPAHGLFSPVKILSSQTDTFWEQSYSIEPSYGSGVEAAWKIVAECYLINKVIDSYFGGTENISYTGLKGEESIHNTTSSRRDPLIALSVFAGISTGYAFYNYYNSHFQKHYHGVAAAASATVCGASAVMAFLENTRKD
ncbi:MAG: hypothetical protein LBJ92_03395 [Holosporales bacterium]|jgi:hypothetical protein|nr:hypothetical protein [Holosporales bacterium]